MLYLTTGTLDGPGWVQVPRPSAPVCVSRNKTSFHAMAAVPMAKADSDGLKRAVLVTWKKVNIGIPEAAFSF